MKLMIILCRFINTIISGMIIMNLRLLRIILLKAKRLISRIIFPTRMIIFQQNYLSTKLHKLVNLQIKKNAKTRKFKSRRKILKTMILICNIRGLVKFFTIALIVKMSHKKTKSFSFRIEIRMMFSQDLVS